MTTRTKKATVITPIVDAAPLGVQPETYRAQMHRLLDEALDTDGVSWKRRAVAFIAGLATSCLVGYAVGKLIAYTMVGAILLTGSSFLALVIFVLGLITAMYLGSKVSVFVYMNVMNENIDAQFAKASNAVRCIFVRRQGVTI